MEIIRSTQRKNKLLYQGYAYVKNKNLANGWVSYECERRRNHKGCTGRVKANGEDVVIVRNHSHTPNPAHNEAMKTIATVKQRAETTVEPVQEIIGNNVSGIADAVSAKLPDLNSIRRNI